MGEDGDGPDLLYGLAHPALVGLLQIVKQEFHLQYEYGGLLHGYDPIPVSSELESLPGPVGLPHYHCALNVAQELRVVIDGEERRLELVLTVGK